MARHATRTPPPSLPPSLPPSPLPGQQSPSFGLALPASLIASKFQANHHSHNDAKGHQRGRPLSLSLFLPLDLSGSSCNVLLSREVVWTRAFVSHKLRFRGSLLRARRPNANFALGSLDFTLKRIAIGFTALAQWPSPPWPLLSRRRPPRSRPALLVWRAQRCSDVSRLRKVAGHVRGGQIGRRDKFMPAGERERRRWRRRWICQTWVAVTNTTLEISSASACDKTISFTLLAIE